jgi:6,7-dimethyl-8-ribityllumazine synthase
MKSNEDTALPAETINAYATKVGRLVQGTHRGVGVRVGIVAGRFNAQITARLLDATLQTLADSGVGTSDITLVWVPGAVEMPFASELLAKTHDVVIALGAVIRGETGHYDLVVDAARSGLQAVQAQAKIPVILGVLTVENLAQALDRSRPDHTNKGCEFALAALEMVSLRREL